MSDNPFASPIESESHQPRTAFVGEGKAPESTALLTTILIICLILGGLGFFGSIIGFVALAFQSTIAEMQQAADPVSVKMQEIQSQQMVPNIIMTGINLIVAPMLFAGALGGLLRKRWAYGLFRIALLSAAIFVGLRTIVATVMQFSMMGELKSAMSAAMQQQGGGNSQQAANVAGTAMEIGLIVGVVFALVIGLMFVAFYLWSWFYTKKDKVRRHFGLSAA